MVSRVRGNQDQTEGAFGLMSTSSKRENDTRCPASRATTALAIPPSPWGTKTALARQKYVVSLNAHLLEG